MLRDVVPQGRNDAVLALVARLVATDRALPMADFATWVIDLLRPLWRTAKEAVLGARVVQMDAMVLPVLADASPCQRELGSLKCFVGDGQTVLYLYTSADKPQGELDAAHLLAGYSGYVVAEGGGRLRTRLPQKPFIECGCNLQARRAFLKAQGSHPTQVIMPLAAFGHLYALEEETQGSAPEVRRAKRQETSKPLYNDLVAWCRNRGRDEPRSSLLGQALGYVLDHEVALSRFLNEGIIPIDNGIFERLEVCASLARKQCLLASDDVGGERAAIAYTLLSCCELAGVNPDEYLADVLPRLSRGVFAAELEELLPARWKTVA